mmetsp:Transcript_2785/g.6540  ORF Transcript_2785/g.6540 Transcript_2785/m.6540 type:complete len:203 (+) Transcript_2785:1660-2268(+)
MDSRKLACTATCLMRLLWQLRQRKLPRRPFPAVPHKSNGITMCRILPLAFATTIRTEMTNRMMRTMMTEPSILQFLVWLMKLSFSKWNPIPPCFREQLTTRSLKNPFNLRIRRNNTNMVTRWKGNNTILMMGRNMKSLWLRRNMRKFLCIPKWKMMKKVMMRPITMVLLLMMIRYHRTIQIQWQHRVLRMQVAFLTILPVSS